MTVKRFISSVTAALMLFCLTACGNQSTDTEAKTDTATAAPGDNGTETNAESVDTAKEKKALILYFSCTGTTKKAAEELQKQTGADILEIKAEIPYTSADLDYNSDCRANREQNDPSARPATATVIDNLNDYDTVYIGFPIWWGTMPKIINTVLDTYDFSGKTLIPFCTSGSSGILEAVSSIKEAEPNATVKKGLRVGDLSEIADWLKAED